MKKSSLKFFLAAATLAMVGASGCSKGNESAAQTGKILVCDPFKNGGSTTATNGVIGAVYQINPALVVPGATVGTLQSTGTLLDATLVASQINVPTTRFTTGFPASDGRVIRTPGGAVLTEYFSLHLEGILALPAGAPEGNYQLGLLADDGAVLQIAADGTNYTVAVNADGVHRANIYCGDETQVVNLTSASRIPFKLDYFQGPREHLALTLVWRQINDGSTAPVAGDVADATGSCGTDRGDNDYYFNTTTTPSVETAAWTGFLAGGGGPAWQVIPAESFLLPSGFTENPCK